MKGTLDSIKSFFDTNIATIVQQVETDFSTVIPDLAYMDTKEYTGKQFPYMVILPDSGYNDFLNEDAPDEVGWKYRNIRVIVADNNSDLEAVQETLLLYEEVIHELVKSDNTFNGAFNRVRVIDLDYSEMGQWKETHKFEQSWRINLEIRKLLSY